MNTMKPVKKVILSEEIANQILEQVKSGQLRPGERLASERELCELFDASRTSVREAIKGLTSMGVLQKRRDGNHICENLSEIIVRPMNILLSSNGFTIQEVAEARIIIESQLARMAALYATWEELAAMEACLEYHDEEPEVLMERAIRFHQLIAASAKNKVLEEMYTVIYRILRERRNNEDGLRRVHRSIQQHRAIFEAIQARNPETAEAAMREHLSALSERKKEEK